MAQIGYIESLLGNVSDLPTKLAIRRVAEELLGRISTLESATGIAPEVPGGPVADISHESIADADALSVFGRAGSTPGPMAPIVAATDGHVLKRTGSTLAFAAVGGGDVVGPASAVDEAIPTFDGTTGKLIRNSTLSYWEAAKVLQFGGKTAAFPGLRPNGALLETVVANQTSYADFRCKDLLNTGMVQPTGFVYPGRADTGAAQGAWYLASHGSYGLYSNTGLYLVGQLYGVPLVGFTSTWSSTGVAPVIGNGSIYGWYVQLGSMVYFKVSVFMGSTTTYGTGQYRFSLPIAWNAGVYSQLVDLIMLDSSGGTWWRGVGHMETAGIVGLRHGATSVNAVSGTAPFTFAVNDQIHISGSYFI